MKKKNLGVYSGYRHNAYDEYVCSWGIIMGLGGERSAFTTNATEMFEKNFNDAQSIDWELVLSNLDCSEFSEEELELFINEKLPELTGTEYWGNTPVIIKLTKNFAKIDWGHTPVIIKLQN